MRTFRAWIDEFGGNEDRQHERHCRVRGRARCEHIRLVDVEDRNYRIWVRLLRRRRPVLLQLLVFFRPYRGTNILRLGRVRWDDSYVELGDRRKAMSRGRLRR